MYLNPQEFIAVQDKLNSRSTLFDAQEAKGVIELIHEGNGRAGLLFIFVPSSIGNCPPGVKKKFFIPPLSRLLKQLGVNCYDPMFTVEAISSFAGAEPSIHVVWCPPEPGENVDSGYLIHVHFFRQRYLDLESAINGVPHPIDLSVIQQLATQHTVKYDSEEDRKIFPAYGKLYFFVPTPTLKRRGYHNEYVEVEWLPEFDDCFLCPGFCGCTSLGRTERRLWEDTSCHATSMDREEFKRDFPMGTVVKGKGDFGISLVFRFVLKSYS
jgi:hypothetical protein